MHIVRQIASTLHALPDGEAYFPECPKFIDILGVKMSQMRQKLIFKNKFKHKNLNDELCTFDIRSYLPFAPFYCC
jgi:hypothetical protein